MLYVLSIDWLSLHCHANTDDFSPRPRRQENLLDSADFRNWRWTKADYGTRQFARLYFVSMPNAAGGYDDFAEVQACPYSGILNPYSVIVRFVNRVLYLPDFWDLALHFLEDCQFMPQGITRIDICADFNDFATIAPLTLIESFASKALRHVGRGAGSLYFNHGVKRGEYSVKYTGLAFGTHGSDARVYLYDKSFELLCDKDKPYIRDIWKAAGLDVLHVWRLEVSIKSGGATFKDKRTGERITIDTDNASDGKELAAIYHTFVQKLFSFVHNRPGIKNITREPRIKLFEDAPAYDRGVIRNVSCSNRTVRMLIKSLWQLADRFRGLDIADHSELAKEFAARVATSTDLSDWLQKKNPTWETPTHL